MSKNTLLSVRNLSVSFVQGDTLIHAVKSVNFSIASREIVGVVGESGSGKSVSMLGAMQLLPPHARRKADAIEWNNNDISQFTNKQMRNIWGKEIAYIYQEPSQSYDPLVNIYETFKEFYKAHNAHITDQKILNKSISLLEEVGIVNARDRIKSYLHQFSGGMIQRVQIALSLVFNPQLLIADEPTTALDVTTQKKVVEMLLQLCKQRHMAMVFITHDFTLVSSFVDRIVVMKDGTIVEEGTPNDILYYPTHSYTKELLATTIKFGDRYVEER